LNKKELYSELLKINNTFMKKGSKRDPLAEAARPVYLITASINYALNELLRAKSKPARTEALKRLEDETKYLKINVTMLRKEAER